MKPKTWILIAVVVLLVGIPVVSWIFKAQNLAEQEFSPQAILDKYEWFKDASAQLDAKAASIGVYEQRMTDLEESYGNASRKDWAREDREQYNIWSSEVSGLKASFNLLAAEYNAQMAKWNYRFANVGELPKGADQPLPREYKPYITE